LVVRRSDIGSPEGRFCGGAGGYLGADRAAPPPAYDPTCTIEE
jgi:hypothetical protein